MEENFEWENIPKETNENPMETSAEEEALALKTKKEEMKKKLRSSSNRIGWATALLIALWMGFLAVISSITVVIDYLSEQGIIAFSGMDFYNKYLLILNEVTLALAIAVAVLILLSLPKAKTEKQPIEFSRFVKILLICFGAGYIGNLIGTMFLTFWNIVTGNSAGGELQEILYGMNPVIMFLSVGVLAPILEELFFRKLLIDRLRPFGKIVSVFLPAFLFALFHMSATQIVYAFAIGAILAYLYYETGKYWLTVIIHAIFNWISGFIPMLFLPKINGFMNDFALIENSLMEVETLEEVTALMMPLLETYGFTLALYAIYLFLVFAINMTGLVLLCLNLKTLRKMKEESLLTFKETVKAVIVNPGMIVCTALLGVLTVFSLFS
ncbi:MAG: CPBP family intramembrane metalloprotease [Ruminococcaceae bacterium]|nr:CPBP family intramembrane metalloprotease [Oscillospiraceae bacterium]